MKISEIEKKLAWILSIGSGITTVIVLAWNTNEPVNAPKLLILTATSFASVFYLIMQWKSRSKNNFIKTSNVLLALFTAFGLISIIASESSFMDGIYGAWGRNTGFLTYFCLALIFASAAQIHTRSAVDTVLNGLFYAGIVNVIYFIFILFGIDLIPWNNVYKTLLGTFGNPNFAGAFMACFVTLCVTKFLDLKSSKSARIFLAILIVLSVLAIQRSHATQGVVVAVLGLAIVGFFYIGRKLNSQKLLGAYSTLVVFIGLFAVAGALQKGPLAQYIYKSSVSYRGEYWAAGWNMGMAHPLTGVGLDSYGLWYRRLREASALESPGKNVVANVAHNVYLDIFASGGFPLFIAYLLLNALVLFKIIKGIRLIREFDSTFIAISGIWICYQVQSTISINQIGLAIWGWILGGLIIGYRIDGGAVTSKVNSFQGSMRLKGIKTPQKQSSNFVLPTLLGAILGLAIASPPFISDVKWRSVLDKPTATNLESQLKSWPSALIRFVQASTLYTNNGMPEKGVEIAKFATEKYPTDFAAWYFYYTLPSTSETEKASIKSRLHELDPLNPDFK